MLGIDTKTDEFAKKIWREVLSMWLKGKTTQGEETNQKFGPNLVLEALCHAKQPRRRDALHPQRPPGQLDGRY